MLTYSIVYFAFLKKKCKDISDYALLIMCLIEMLVLHFFAGSGVRFWGTISKVSQNK